MSNDHESNGAGRQPARDVAARFGSDAPPPSMRAGARPRPYFVHFGEPGRKLAGFFHPPLPALAAHSVVVLCKPIGWEAIAANRAYRELAERLASGGFPTLRFDYLGTGDSSGDDTSADVVKGWLDSCRQAIAEARRLSGNSRVCLVGVHLGATLATLAALDSSDVSSLVLWAPYATGRSYVREAKAYSRLNDQGGASLRAEDDGSIEAAGFLLSAATQRALSEIDLRTLPRAPAKSVLVLSRDGSGAELPLVAQLQQVGAEVTHSATTGYAGLMQEPRKSVMPKAELATIVAFLERANARDATDTEQARLSEDVHVALEPARAGGAPAQVGPRPTLAEAGFWFGPEERLFGILTEDEAQAQRLARPAVLLLNTAPHTRIGPNRMYVPIARQLAEVGFTALRFDLNGVGDSTRFPGAEPSPIYSKAFIRDVQLAMEALEQRGYRRFLLVGLCSGAYLGFHAALADARVEGVAMVNPQTFDWQDGDSLEVGRRVSVASNSYYKRAILEPANWVRAVTGKVDLRTIGRAMLGRARHRAGVELKRALGAIGAVDLHGWVDVAGSFETLLKRGTRTYLIYSEDDEGVDHLISQVGTRMRRLKQHERFCIDFVNGADHTFSPRWAQSRLRQMLLTHLEKHYGAVPTASKPHMASRPPPVGGRVEAE